jgi:2-oxo-4-hydroxy-4-carboxy-5-ureidoimidazoline decarboxylase
VVIEGIGLDGFNALPDAEARTTLAACCAAPGWVDRLARARPFASTEALYDESAAALAALDEAGLAAALAAHPRIGEAAAVPSAPAPDDALSRSGDAASAWSRREQAGVSQASAETRQALAEGNHAYEQRFGHVYLVAAAGRSAEELLALLQERLTHDAATERDVVRTELSAITAARLARMIGR